MKRESMVWGMETRTTKVLDALEEAGEPFPEFEFYRINNQIQVLGSGATSIVCEMVRKNCPDRHYALKVIGLNTSPMQMQLFWDTFRIQKILGDGRDDIVRYLAAKVVSVQFDSECTVKDIRTLDEKNELWLEEGMILQFVLMEKLDEILSTDKFHNRSLVRTELQNEKQVIEFALQVGTAIQYAHEEGVLHRDIKLENIFWDEKSSSYKLGDFGVARFTRTGNAETVVYTDGYGAPEIRMRLRNNYDVTADIYSFGITLYLLLNRLCFPGSSDYHANIGVQYNPQSALPAPMDASVPVVRVIRRMCSFDKNDRYQSMAEVLAAWKAVRPERNSELPKEEQEELDTLTFREDVNDEQNLIDRNEEEKASEQQIFNRAEQRRTEIAVQRYYREESIWYLIGFSVLFALWYRAELPIKQEMFRTIGTQVLNWILPATILWEAFLVRNRDFHIIFGVITFFLHVYAMVTGGVTLFQIMLLLGVLSGIPSFMAATGIGAFFWLLCLQNRGFLWMDFFARHDLGWFFLSLICGMMIRFVFVRYDTSRVSDSRSKIGIWICDKAAAGGMALIGLILLFLQRFHVLQLPYVVCHLHLVKVGIATCILYVIIYIRRCISMDEDESEINIEDRME